MTIRKIITRAFRESGVVPVGGDVEAEEFEEGLETLNSMIGSLFGNQLGEPLRDYYPANISTNEEFPVNYRVVLNTSSPASIKLAAYPMPGARLAIIDNTRNLATYPLTINANGRKIEGVSSLVLSTNSQSTQWFYRDDLAAWVKITDLTANGESPFPPEFDDFLVTLLAYRLNPRFGAQTSDSSIEVLKRLQSQFKARYSQVLEQRSELALLQLGAGRNRGYYFDNFNTGH